jgi:hypothetical protein
MSDIQPIVKSKKIRSVKQIEVFEMMRLKLKAKRDHDKQLKEEAKQAKKLEKEELRKLKIKNNSLKILV